MQSCHKKDWPKFPLTSRTLNYSWPWPFLDLLPILDYKKLAKLRKNKLLLSQPLLVELDKSLFNMPRLKAVLSVPSQEVKPNVNSWSNLVPITLSTTKRNQSKTNSENISRQALTSTSTTLAAKYLTMFLWTLRTKAELYCVEPFPTTTTLDKIKTRMITIDLRTIQDWLSREQLWKDSLSLIMLLNILKLSRNCLRWLNKVKWRSKLTFPMVLMNARMLWLNFWKEKTSEKLSSKFHNLNQNSDCMY